ncbi:hypothetical protein [Coleofasciculus sp. FACHB-1120]|uniref:hypothetical protein n=1 Tax=Coleofasciculus sp. FACHB-1120 TaxID=2692783 RepID=UPI00168723AC|nr:hypothetical protein [Coleofasciculus sp. FACHB-1120]MBD2742017.1 hypothetical protein [Coleofasciculus sp. FACHB-1120]
MIAELAKARMGNPTEALQYLMSLGTKPRLWNGRKLPTEAGLKKIAIAQPRSADTASAILKRKEAGKW